jgi:hypothetical protein
MKDVSPLCRAAHRKITVNSQTLATVRGSIAVLRFARLSSRFDAIASTTGRCVETPTHPTSLSGGGLERQRSFRAVTIL